MKKLALLFFILIQLSCKSYILKTYYGLKDPEIECQTSIKRFLVKNKIDTTDVFVFKDFNSFTRASKMKLLRVPDAIFFNKAGNYVSYKKSATDCNAKIGTFISDLNSFPTLEQDENRKLNDLITLITNNKNQKLETNDVNVFITWGVFAGKLNRDKAFQWVKLLKQAQKDGVKVNYYLLNCDLQEGWNIPSTKT